MAVLTATYLRNLLFLVFLIFIGCANCINFFGTTHIGGDCIQNADCVGIPGVSSECVDRECACKRGYIAAFLLNDCLQIIDIINGTCSEHPQCRLGLPGPLSKCTDGKCTCVDDAISEPIENICREIQNELGDECVANAQCRANLGEDSICSRNTCNCDLTKSVVRSDNKFCLPFINTIGEDICEETPQCTEGVPGDLSECSEKSPPDESVKVCACLETAINEPGSHLCYQKANLVGEPCEVTAQCTANLGELSQCTDKFCICPDTTSLVGSNGTKCLEIVEVIGGNCTENQQCVVGEPGEWSECSDDGTCRCNNDAVQAPETHKCYLKTESVGGSCEFDIQCTESLGEYSICAEEEAEDTTKSKFCICKTEAIASKNQSTCLLVINEIGGSCKEPQQCSAGLPGDLSDCVISETDPAQGSICNCTTEAIIDGNVCLRKAGQLDDPCNITKQCTENLGDLSKCSDHEDGEEGICICQQGAVGNTDKTRCVVGGISIGQPCDDDTQCVGGPDFAECASWLCGCKPDYISSHNLEECLPIRNEIGSDCKEIQQCQQGDLGEYSECATVDSTKSICNCTTDAITAPGENRCRKKATFVGDACEVQSQCYANLGYSQCFLGSCVCLGNATASSNNTKCILKSFLDQPCEDQNQCNWIPSSASCQVQNVTDPSQGRTCRCDSGFIAPSGKNDACYKIASLIGDSCENDPIQCINLEESMCLPEGKICGCDELHVVGTNRKTCLPRVDQLHSECRETTQCTPLNSACVFDRNENTSFCLCSVGEYIESEKTPGKCLKIQNELRLPCEEEQQCVSGLGILSECRDGFCFCRYNYAYYDGYCYTPAKLTERCYVDGECHAGVNNYTFCNPSDMRCRCLPGAIVHDNTCYATKYVGDLCNSNVECALSILGNVICDSSTNRCTCFRGYSAEYGNSVCSSASLPQLISNTVAAALMFSVFIFQ